MTSSQDRDGLNGLPTTSKPDENNSPSTPIANAKTAPGPPNPPEPLTPIAPAASPLQDTEERQTQSLAQPQASASPKERDQHQQESHQGQEPADTHPRPHQNAGANIQTPPRPRQPSDSFLSATHTPAAIKENGTAVAGSSMAPAGHNVTPLTTHTNGDFNNTVANWLANSIPVYTGAGLGALGLGLGNASMYAPQSSDDAPLWGLPQPGMDIVPANYDQVDDIASDGEEDDGYAPDVTTYGCLEFDDSTFWITTRSVLIGRDQAAYTQAKKQRERERKLGLNAGTTIHSPDKPPARYQAYTKSYISEEGGLLGPESDGEGNLRPTKRRKTNAAGQLATAKQQQQEGQARSRIISSRQYIDHTPGAVLVDVDHLRPSDDFVARVRIHGQAPDVVENTKGISRDHAKIQYNSRTRLWEIVILGRNGLFHNDVHHDKDAVVTLRSGDSLQIQSVCFRFFITGVEKGMTGAEEDSASDAPISKTYSQGGKEMSFEFQSRDDGDKETSNSSVMSGDEPLVLESASNQSEISDKEMEDASDLQTPDQEDVNDGDADGTIRETVERDTLEDDNLKKSPSADDAGRLDQLLMPPKKRGPGRPPKNGVMSKREERLLKKLAQEEAKKNMPPQEPGEQPQKRKVGRPRKHPRPEEEGDQPEKRKYKPRKPKGEGEEDDADGERPSKEKSQKAKTPPLVLKREDYTEEQLQKPTKNYQLLIDEIMVGAPTNGYSLKQIYKRIQKRWPYFYFSVDTKGWESSVRHNLLGSECFKKIDGHWHRVPGVPLESGKKQRKPSPIASPRPAGLYNTGGYGHHPYQPPGHPQHPGHQPIAHNTGLSQPNLPPRYPPNGQAYQIAQGPPHRPGQPGVTPSQQPLVRPGFPQPQAPTAAPHAHGYVNATRPQYAANQAPSYNPAFGNRPQPPPGTNPGAAGAGAAKVPGQNPAQRPPPARPGQAPPSMPHQGFQPAQTHAQPNAQRTALATHQQPSLPNSAPPAPLGPVIDPILRDFIKDFKAEVIKQLQAREGKRSEAVAMSVINRGLGLTDRSLTPECEQYEKLILDIFYQHKATFPTVLASKRRAQEASRAAYATPANPGPVATPPSNINRTMASTLPQANGAPAASAMPAAKAAIGTVVPDTSRAVVTNGPANASSTRTGAIKTEDSKASGNAVSGLIQTAAPKPAQGGTAPGTNSSSTVATVATTPSAPTSTNPASNSQPATMSIPPKPSNSPALSVPANTKSPAPASASANPAPATPVVTGPAAMKPVAGNSIANAPPSTRENGAVGTATNTPTTSTTALPKPAIVSPATSNVPTTVAPAPTPKPAAVTAVPTAPASTVPRGAASGQPTPTAAPAASSSPAPASNGPRAGSTPSASTPVSDKKDVQLLDPKLVTLILSFKRTILPTLVGRLGLLLGESLVMSAVDRLLGFTDETFVQAKNEQQKQHFQEAEKALMMHLETRFKEYVRNRTTSK